MGKQYRRSKRTFRKVYRTPKRPWEKERLDRELKICGQYGLRNKRELWRIQLTLSRIRKKARHLLTLPITDPVRLVEGASLLRKCKRFGLLQDSNAKLDHVLALTEKDFLERRLQTIVLSNKIGAKSIHHARILVQHGHIMVGNQKVDIPSFMVRVDSEKHVQISPFSSLAPTGKPGRKKKKTIRNKINNRKGKKRKSRDPNKKVPKKKK